MSVPSWERDLSRTEYLYSLYKFNIRLGQIIMGKPKKYRENYGDKIICTGLDALKFAQAANSIYMCETTSNADYERRRNYLLNALALVDNISTISEIFLSLNSRMDGASRETIEKQQLYIGSESYKIHNLIKGVLERDKRIIRKQTV